MKTWMYMAVLVCTTSFAQGAEWSLNDALAFARTNSPDAQIARQKIASAQALLQQANSAFWPTAQLQSSYTRTDNPIGVFGAALNQRSYSPALNFNNVPDADNLNVRGIVTVPLYAGGRNTAGRKAAVAQTKASRAESEATQLALEFEIAKSWLTVLKARLFRTAVAETVRAYEANLDQAKKRQAAGLVLEAERLDLEVRLAQSREDLVKANHGATLALLGLKTLLGMDDDSFEITEILPRMEEINPGLSRVRPELQAMSFQEEAAEAEVRRARGGHLPKVSAFGQADQDYGFRFNGSGRSYAGGVVAQWDVWDGGQTRGRIAEATARLSLVQAERRKLEFNLKLEAEQSRLQVQDAAERLSVTEQTVRQAEESVRLTRVRFEQGAALTTQLIDAESALTSAKIRQAEARTDEQIARAALRKAMGWPQTSDQK